jgi:predicted nucleic acid-binding protein
MERQKKVVDASVLVKCFVHEKGSDEALELWEEHTSGKSLLVVPELVFSEILNALRFKQFDLAKLQAADRILWDAQFHIERTNRFLLDRAIVLALKYKLSLYDATYLALSQVFGSPLYTSDEKLSKCPNTVTV